MPHLTLWIAIPLASLVLVSAPVGAQDLGGAMDLSQFGRDQAHGDTIKNSARKSARRPRRANIDPSTIRACRKLRSLRNPTSPRLRRGIALCRGWGY